ncbi:MAG: aa3-type cytochrome c oxidase subunit II CoxB [Bacteroidetes bacterium HLUCCA01]|nr:MAG: aa3-type cytochrome c oxidase subunit II CoxB [Bacteroidetes bacterium HLUCCA01]
MLETINRLILPQVSSTFAADVDGLFTFINVASAIILLGITVAIIYFSVKYKRKSEDDVTPVIRYNTTLELTWTIIPLILILIVFAWGFRGHIDMRTPPSNAYEVYVTANSFFWQFTYPNGVQTTDELYVPAGRPVKLIMQSRDVIHSFFVPDFRVKQDVLPGRYTTAWFQTLGTGEHVIFCTEYCGSGHSDMDGMVYAIEPEEFDAWLREQKELSEQELPLAVLGQNLYQQQGCAGCHSLDGNVVIGPSFQGLYMDERQGADGSSRVADEDYLRESINNPGEFITSGFNNIMPGYSYLSEDQVSAIIEFIKEQQ